MAVTMHPVVQQANPGVPPGFYDLIQPASYIMRKYLSPVFDTPDDMVVYVVYACPCVSIFILHTGSIS